MASREIPRPSEGSAPVACGNGNISRGYLSSPPTDESPLKEIAVKLRSDSSDDRLKADVWATARGEFKDRPGIQRRFPGVNSGEGRWDFQPDENVEYVPHRVEPYTHMTGRVGWLGTESLLSKLPADVREDIEGRRFIVLGKDPDQKWVNQRNTTVTSDNYDQKTVVRPAQVVFRKR
jgi:hypothetical protein